MPQYVQAEAMVQPGEVESYIAHHGLDERCAERLKELAPAVQLQVMQTDVSAARNVSAVVSSNIHKAARGGSSLESMPLRASYSPQPNYIPMPQYVPAEALAQPGEVEAFILRHGLDERCAEKLKALAPAAQLQVMQMDVSAARNVSAVVSSNIQKAARGGSSLEVMPVRASYSPQASYIPVSVVPAAQPMPQYVPLEALAQPGEVEAYIAQYGLDERCAEKLKALAPAAQLQVMQTDVSAARNVSAVVSSNIQKAARGGSSLEVMPLRASYSPQPNYIPVSVVPAAQPMPQYVPAEALAQPGEVEAYIAQHGLDERCAEKLKALAPAAQLQVMQMDVSAARNVSAVVSSNVQKAAARGGSSLEAMPLKASYSPQPNYIPMSVVPAAQPMPQYVPLEALAQPGEVEAYIAQHGLDERCAEKLKALAPVAQLQVMQMDVSAARNVSAVVSSNVQKAAARDPPFARHEHMLLPVRMQQPMQLPMQLPMPSTHGPVGWGQMDLARGATEAYIAQHRLDERCAAKLRSLPLLSQLQVMGTSVSAARNVSAVVSKLCDSVPPPDPVESYIAAHCLDERCAGQLRALAPAEQSQVMQTDVSGARNVSAVVSSNILKAMSGQSGTKRARDDEPAWTSDAQGGSGRSPKRDKAN